MSRRDIRYGEGDADPRKMRPDVWTQNAAGESFHTYVDPDRFPAIARADELLWQRDRRSACLESA